MTRGGHTGRMTTAPPPVDQRRAGILMLGVAAVFVAVAIVAAVVVSPWLLLVGLTAIPNVIAAVKTIRAPGTSEPEDDPSPTPDPSASA